MTRLPKLAPPPPGPARFHRRDALRLGLLGIGALAIPYSALAQAAAGFTHGVASGEPGRDSVMLWTRFGGAGDGARLTYEVAATLDFARVVAGGSVTAGPATDWCVKPVATGLEPGRWYYYRFIAPGGEASAVGRTRTLPEGAVGRFGMAVFSCANLGFGWFNAYGHAAARDDIDLAVHLGDYLYEYQRGAYPAAAATVAGRLLDPAREIVALADYRLRHAAYRADPDLQRLHQLFPMVMMWDDHESANDSWKGGAENHQPDREGGWDARKLAAKRAFREWLPVTDSDWTSYEIGDLATLLRPETRLTARDRPFELGEVLKDVSPERTRAALAAFRDGAWRDPTRTMLGAEQERWLVEEVRRSARAGKRWQVLAQQVIMGFLSIPPEIGSRAPADAAEAVRKRLETGKAAAEVGLPYNMDAWDGYPAARSRLLNASLEAEANLVVLTGDSHNAWAFDLANEGRAAGVEFAGHSVTSPGAESAVSWIDPAEFARIAVAGNPQLEWAETSRRGYMAVELTPARASAEYVFMDTVTRRSTALAGRRRLSVEAGRNRLG